MKRIAIVDDNIRLAKELRLELLQFNDIEWIKVYDSGLKYAGEISSFPEDELPHCILMDISMKQQDEGIVATRLLHAAFPDIKVVMFTISDDDDRVFEAFKAGALGYLLKNEKPSFIYKTIVDVIEGGALMSPAIALRTIWLLTHSESSSVAPRTHSGNEILTNRELEVLRLISKGYTYQIIADQLFISVQTIKKHMTNIFKKLQVNNKMEAINKTKGFL